MRKKKLKAAVNLIFQDRVFHKLEENNILVGDIDIRVNLGAKLFSGSNLNFGCVHAIPDSNNSLLLRLISLQASVTLLLFHANQ